MTIILIILFIVLLIGAVVYCTISMMKQSKREWSVLEELERESLSLKTKEEIDAFHKKFIAEAVKIDNFLIYPRLAELRGYISGLYQQYK